MGRPELDIAFFLIILVACIESWRLRHAGPNLVLQEFRCLPSDGGEFLYILGRRAGILAWLLRLVGLQALTSFSVTQEEVARETVGPSGFEALYAPLVEVSASRCSYYRAFWVLILSLTFYCYGLLSLVRAALESNDYDRRTGMMDASYILWGCLICGTLLYVWYALSKRVVISVRAKGPVDIGISFKRSIIDNKTVELKKAIEAVDLVNARILADGRQN